MLKKISYKGVIFGYILSFSKKNGVNFLTPVDLSHQVAFIKHKKKHSIKPHCHFKNIRIIKYTSEVLIILKGKLRVDFYKKNKKYLFSKIIKKNNIIILNQGGHGFKVIQPIEMIEVKQGPYNLRLDKKVFDAIEEKKIRLK
jgi:hypothetical protein